jgi:hypothetical protein
MSFPIWREISDTIPSAHGIGAYCGTVLMYQCEGIIENFKFMVLFTCTHGTTTLARFPYMRVETSLYA